MAAENPAEETERSEPSSAEEASEPTSPEAAEAGEGEGENRRARRAAAARARKQRIRERREAEAIGLDAQEVFDDALVRSRAKAGKWLKDNSTILQWLIVGGLVAWAGWGGYGVFMANARAEASDVLAEAISAERGRIGDPEEEGKVNENNVVDLTKVYKDNEARLAAAREAFRAATEVRPGSGTATWAELSLGSVLFDLGKLDEAKAAFESVRRSSFANTDPELSGRALEGIALVQEAQGDQEAALKTYAELEKTQTLGFVKLAQVHQARLLHALGRTEEAKTILEKVREQQDSAAYATPNQGYLELLVKSLTEELDPEAAERLNKPPPITEERLKQLQEEVKRKINAAPPTPAPESPTPPPPAVPDNPNSDESSP